MVDLNIDYVEDLATRFLPLETWGFVESTRTESLLIYNSQWCRFRFHIHTDWHSKYLILTYGRLHAVDDTSTMKWKGEECYCWLDPSRNLTIFLQFLDGLTPAEAYSTSQEPLMLSKNFETSLLASHPGINSLELECIKHAMIWEHYGLHFFEVFDLRRSDLWDKYISFLKEYFHLYYEKLDANLARQGQTRTPHDIPPYRRC
jgi:hypothetical protein